MPDTILSADDIQVADPLEIRGPDPQTGDARRYRSSVQDVTDEGIVVAMPVDGRVVVPLPEGTSVVASIWKGHADHRFSTQVLRKQGGHLPQLVLAKPAPADITRTPRRGFFRVETRIAATVHLFGADRKSRTSLPATVVDLSAAGCRVQTSARLPVGSFVTLDFELPFPPDGNGLDRARPLHQIPARTKSAFSPAKGRGAATTTAVLLYGVQFENPDNVARNALLRYVAFRQRELINLLLESEPESRRGDARLQAEVAEAREGLQETEHQLAESVREEFEVLEDALAGPPAPAVAAATKATPPPVPEPPPQDARLSADELFADKPVPAPPAEQAAAAPSGKTVLLVDDEARIRELQVEFLQHEGHATLEASNGKEALELAQRLRPDLIVTDLMMPVMNGWRLLASLRQAGIEVPVILITGYMSQEGQEVLASKDIAGFLVKPVDLEELADMVRRVLFPQSLDRRRRILAVDDQEDMLLFIGMQLRQAGFEVETALSGAEALAKAGSFKPDLVLLDIVMPQVDGFAVCQRLRSRPETADVPVIMLAAKTSAEYVRRAVALKVSGYLVKPFDPEVLVTRIRRVLEGAGKG